MRSLILLFVCFSSIIIMAVNGQHVIHCDGYEDWNLPEECKCPPFSYDNCPLTCPIDSCTPPAVLHCEDYPTSRLPSICNCGIYDEFSCPLACNGQCGHHHHEIPEPPPPHIDHGHDQPPGVQINIHARGNTSTNFKIEWLILLTIFGWNIFIWN